MYITSLLSHSSQLLNGLSYWKVILTTGKEFSEFDRSFDLLRGIRPVDWALDIVGSGDNAKVAELILCTPHGNAHMRINEPYTALQLKRGVMSMLGGGERIIEAQIIGRVDNKETGECTATIWDVTEQKLYLDHKTNVKHFTKWREGISDIGALSVEVVGVRLT